MFMPLLLVPVVLSALGLGFVLSIANLVIRDTANALGTALTIGMFSRLYSTRRQSAGHFI